jgi:hypothetical protein
MERLFAAALLLMLSATADAACPVGIKENGKWCTNHQWWKCVKCGSEYCPILTGESCYKPDDLDAPPAAAGDFKSRLVQAIRRGS